MHMRVPNGTLPENERSEAHELMQRSGDAEVRRRMEASGDEGCDDAAPRAQWGQATGFPRHFLQVTP
jgi:hypothetical protein